MPKGASTCRKTFRLTGEIGNDLILELELMALALATGIMDATTFSDYHVFVSNQTGNTALLAVGALGVGGSIVNLFQTALVAVATALRWRYPTADGTPGSLAVLTLLAFSSGGQIAVARKVNVPEITTAMVTSAYIDLIIDSHLITPENRPRTRRFFLICMLLIGSFIGAIADRYYNNALALLLSAICKLVVTVSFLTNADASDDDELGGKGQSKELSVPAGDSPDGGV